MAKIPARYQCALGPRLAKPRIPRNGAPLVESLEEEMGNMCLNRASIYSTFVQSGVYPRRSHSLRSCHPLRAPRFGRTTRILEWSSPFAAGRLPPPERT